MAKKKIKPQVSEFLSANYDTVTSELGEYVVSLSSIRKASVDSIVCFSEDDPLRVIDATDIASDSVWFRMHCTALRFPSSAQGPLFFYLLVDLDCTKYMSMLCSDVVKQRFVLKLSSYDREILQLAIGQYMSKL